MYLTLCVGFCKITASIKELIVVGPARFLLLFCALLMISVPSHARDVGGSDSGHTGGGGTFIRSELSKQLQFWDLFEHGTTSRQPQGDRLEIPAGSHGGWVNFRRLRSFRYLEKQVHLWEKWEPQFAEFFRAAVKSQPDWIVTGLWLQSVNEFEKIPGHGFNPTAVAIPGAHFDYANGALLVNAKVFNGAGLVSQAAMILHELLRASQARLHLDNEYIQGVVSRVADDRPDLVSMANDPKYDGLFNDSFLKPDPNAPAAPPPHGANADAEVAAALANGILGEKLFELPLAPLERNGQYQAQLCKNELDCDDDF